MTREPIFVSFTLPQEILDQIRQNQVKTVMRTIVALAVLAAVVAGFLGYTQPGRRVLSALGSIAYHSRGVAYKAKGDNDRAIADYSEAIRDDPKHGFGYDNRGVAYKAKGDNDRAIAG